MIDPSEKIRQQAMVDHYLEAAITAIRQVRSHLSWAEQCSLNLGEGDIASEVQTIMELLTDDEESLGVKLNAVLQQFRETKEDGKNDGA